MEEIGRDSCDHVPEPSIITTSKICAGMMIGESIMFLRGVNVSHLISGYITYDVFEPKRMAVVRKHFEKEGTIP